MPGAGEFLGDWVVVRPLGQGGMGSVLLCHSQLSDEVQAAVKVLKAHGLGDFRRRFVDEMRTLASLSHPSIVSVLSGGQDVERDLVYMAMELIDGGDLEQRMRHGALTRDEAEAVFLPIADALAYAHRNGVHHRDLKPANLMLRKDGPPVLVDFGIAVASDRTRLTTEGMVPGTAAYMPPEVFRGDALDHGLADIYALGVVLYEALTGEHAFWIDGDMSDGQRLFQVVGLKVQSAALDPGPDIDEPLRELVKSMTEPDPSRRLTDLSEVARAFGTVPAQTTWVMGSTIAAAEQTTRDIPAPAPEAAPAPVSEVTAANVVPRKQRGKRALWALGGGLAAVGIAALALAAVGVGAVAWTSLGGVDGPAYVVDEAVYTVDERIVEVAVEEAPAPEATAVVAEEADEDLALAEEDILRPVRTAAVAARPEPVRRVVRAPEPAVAEAVVEDTVAEEALAAEVLDVVAEDTVEPAEVEAPKWTSTKSTTSLGSVGVDEDDADEEDDQGGRRRRWGRSRDSGSSGSSGSYGGSYGGGYGY